MPETQVAFDVNARAIALNPDCRWTMNGRIASLVALLPMLFHSIFGCCWHHVHASPDGHHAPVAHSDDVALVSQHEHVGCPFHSHAAHSQPFDQQNDGEPVADRPADSPCEDDRCDGIAMAITTTPQLTDLARQAVTPFAIAETPAVPPLLLALESHRHEFLRSPSVRERCALTQVWLI